MIHAFEEEEEYHHSEKVRVLRNLVFLRFLGLSWDFFSFGISEKPENVMGFFYQGLSIF